MGIQTKIQVWNDALKVYKHQVAQDNAKCMRFVAMAFQLFECLLSKEYCKQWTKIQILICDHEWEDHNGVTQPKHRVT